MRSEKFLTTKFVVLKNFRKSLPTPSSGKNHVIQPGWMRQNIALEPVFSEAAVRFGSTEAAGPIIGENDTL